MPKKPLPVPQEPLSQMSMGMAVRACRQASDRTMTAVAKSTGLALSVLSRIETGSRGLGYSEAVTLANDLGVPLDKFAHMARAIEKNGAPERIKENRQLAEDMITMAQNANALREFIAA